MGTSAVRSDLAALRRALTQGTALQVVNEALRRVDDSMLHAVLATNASAAAEAAVLDAVRERSGQAMGPLHGVPVLVKDVFETRGIETTFGCSAFRGYVPAEDAEAVRRLRAAGAVVIGKTSTPDLALSWLSDTSRGVRPVNPTDPLRDAGGSSSGSAVAVAAGLVPVALGSDTGGSVRVPAVFNGVVGFRPTTGLVPTQGMSALVSVQDTPGVLATSVEDVATVLEVLSGMPLGSRPRGTVRLGVLANRFPDTDWPGAEEVAERLSVTLDRLAVTGVQVDSVVVPDLDRLLRASALYLVTARADIDRFLGSRPGPASFRQLYDGGAFPDSLDLAHLIASRSNPNPVVRTARVAGRRRLRQAVVGAMDEHGVDALVYPPVRAFAPPGDRDRRALPSTTLPVNTLIAAQADLPALVLPAGFEMLGRHGADAALLDVGRQVERVLSGG